MRPEVRIKHTVIFSKSLGLFCTSFICKVEIVKLALFYSFSLHVDFSFSYFICWQYQGLNSGPCLLGKHSTTGDMVLALHMEF
jgi:hypothetical protein